MILMAIIYQLPFIYSPKRSPISNFVHFQLENFNYRSSICEIYLLVMNIT